MIVDKYGITRGGGSWKTRHAILPFRCIVEEYYEEIGVLVKSTALEVEDGGMFIFWEHSWCGNMLLKMNFKTCAEYLVKEMVKFNKTRGKCGDFLGLEI